MDQVLWFDVQEALLYIFWPLLAWTCVFIVAGGVFAGLLAFAMELSATRRNSS